MIFCNPRDLINKVKVFLKRMRICYIINEIVAEADSISNESPFLPSCYNMKGDWSRKRNSDHGICCGGSFFDVEGIIRVLPCGCNAAEEFCTSPVKFSE